MKHRTLTPRRVSLALAAALLGVPATASADDPFGLCYWALSEGSGSTTYPAYCSYNGTLGASAQWSTGDGRTFISASPTSSTDTNGYVDFGNAAGAFGTYDFTVAHAFRTSISTGSSALYGVLGDRTSYGHGNFFAVRMRGDGILSVELDQDGAGTNYVGLVGTGHPVNDGSFHFLAYVRQGAALRLYIDGALIASASTGSGLPTSISGAAPLRIGAEANTAPITADYDNVAVYYGLALTQAQIQSISQGL